MTKSLQAFILAVLLMSAGAVVHSHAEDWSESTVGQTLIVDYAMKSLFQDLGISMMATGGIAFTLSLIAWLYPPRQS